MKNKTIKRAKTSVPWTNPFDLNEYNLPLDFFLKNCYDILENGQTILKENQNKIIQVSNKHLNLSPKSTPVRIRYFIDTNNGTTYKITANINDINIFIYFTNYERLRIETIYNYAMNSLLAIYFLTIHNKPCNKNIDIFIYLTPFKKMAPASYDSILGSAEINTGYSSVGCKNDTQIIIYRKEEWFKVLIHELLHNLYLDFATYNIDESIKELYKLFKLNIKYNINETYVETWARIINIVITSKIKSYNYNKYSETFKFLLNQEIIFSLQQARTILKFVNYSFNYTENTSAYAYYVFTSALLYNYIDFLNWNYSNNINIFNFKKTKKNIKLFTELIIYSFKKSSYQRLLTSIYNNNNNNNSLRMSRLDYL